MPGSSKERHPQDQLEGLQTTTLEARECFSPQKNPGQGPEEAVLPKISKQQPVRCHGSSVPRKVAALLCDSVPGGLCAHSDYALTQASVSRQSSQQTLSVLSWGPLCSQQSPPVQCFLQAGRTQGPLSTEVGGARGVTGQCCSSLCSLVTATCLSQPCLHSAPDRAALRTKALETDHRWGPVSSLPTPAPMRAMQPGPGEQGRRSYCKFSCVQYHVTVHKTLPILGFSFPIC